VNQEHNVSLLRIIDVNANRAAEGLRVVEEYVRFVLDDAHLTQLQKQLRHDLNEALQFLSRDNLCAARDTEQDIGTNVTTPAEFERRTVRDVAAANQKRVEQSLRALEEFIKPLSTDSAGRIEQLRYRAYTLGRAIELTDHACQQLEQAALYVLVDAGETLDDFAETVSGLIRAGVHLLQLRAPQCDDRLVVERGHCLRELTRGTPTRFIMNNRPDLAVVTHADGVHLGQDDLSVKDARAVTGTKMLIGVSTHSISQARQAVIDGANYLGCGPTFPSQTKAFHDFPGLAFLEAVHREIALPPFAIGGIDQANLAAVRATGFSRIAVSNAVTGAADPALAVRQLLNELGTQEGYGIATS